MTPEQRSCFAYTVSHFQEIALQNRFAENATIAHDSTRCVICHPELLPLEPFEIYLDVVTQSIKMRRPRLDGELVDEINKDLDLVGIPSRVSLASLAAGYEEAKSHWSGWIRDALTTGLGLLSVHSAASRDFSLEEGEGLGFERIIEEKVQELMAYQKKNGLEGQVS